MFIKNNPRVHFRRAMASDVQKIAALETAVWVILLKRL